MTRKQWELWKQGKYKFTKNDTYVDSGEPFEAKDKNGIKKKYYIRTSAKDGHIPHFHVMNDEDGFDSEICIYEAKYYNNTKDTLSNDQIDKLAQVMLKGCKGLSSETFTYWDYVSTIFISGQHSERMKKDFIIDFYVQENCPDYNLLKK